MIEEISKITFDVIKNCECCKFVTFDEDTDEANCSKYNKEIDPLSNCNDWKFDKSLISDTFWIKRVSDKRSLKG